jgi:hypothetical protein
MSRLPVCVALVCMIGCGGSCPQAESPEPVASAEPAPAEASSDSSEASPTPATVEQPAEKADEPVTDVKFPEGASVSEAVAAVPRGTARSNIDAETLAEPLQNESVWAPCKVGAQHFKVKVAVWNGHAVGVDVTTPSKPLASCVEKQVRSIEWRDKVRSLNSVEYSM